jgi:hypothetical protein
MSQLEAQVLAEDITTLGSDVFLFDMARVSHQTERMSGIFPKLLT